MMVVAGIRMRRAQRRASPEKVTAPRLVAMMARGERGSHNLKPTIYLRAGSVRRPDAR